MLAHRRLFTAMLGLLAMELAAAYPRLLSSTLFVSEEEEGLVRNIEYVDQLRSTEEVATKSRDSICAINSRIHMTPKIMHDIYEVFTKVLVRDSRKVTKQKLREVKSTYSDKETDIGHFFLMKKTFGKVNVTWEGELIFFAILEIADEASYAESNENNIVWLEQLFERIKCAVLKANFQGLATNVVDSISIEKEISEHFDVFKQFWLAYAKTKRIPRHTSNAPVTEKKHGNQDFSCVIHTLEFPLISANITYRAFAEVLMRDSQIVIEKKLKESQTANTADLSTMLKKIKSYQLADASQQGKPMYKKLQQINRERDADSLWQNDILDRCLCHAQKVRTERDFQNLIEHITMVDIINEHFDVFKQFWLSYSDQ